MMYMGGISRAHKEMRQDDQLSMFFLFFFLPGFMWKTSEKERAKTKTTFLSFSLVRIILWSTSLSLISDSSKAMEKASNGGLCICLLIAILYAFISSLSSLNLLHQLGLNL